MLATGVTLKEFSDLGLIPQLQKVRGEETTAFNTPTFDAASSIGQCFDEYQRKCDETERDCEGDAELALDTFHHRGIRSFALPSDCGITSNHTD